MCTKFVKQEPVITPVAQEDQSHKVRSLELDIRERDLRIRELELENKALKLEVAALKLDVSTHLKGLQLLRVD